VFNGEFTELSAKADQAADAGISLLRTLTDNTLISRAIRRAKAVAPRK
jgi:hypothetical protein